MEIRFEANEAENFEDIIRGNQQTIFDHIIGKWPPLICIFSVEAEGASTLLSVLYPRCPPSSVLTMSL